MGCLNLKEQFGQRFKIEYAESYHADCGVRARLENPWLMILYCRNGHICPWGGSTLAACTKGNGPVANRLRKLPCTTVAQDGDDGVNALFDVADFDKVAAIMHPKRRKRLSESQKQKNIERLRKYWPTKGETVQMAAVQHAKTIQECNPRVDSV